MNMQPIPSTPTKRNLDSFNPIPKDPNPKAPRPTPIGKNEPQTPRGVYNLDSSRISSRAVNPLLNKESKEKNFLMNVEKTFSAILKIVNPKDEEIKKKISDVVSTYSCPKGDLGKILNNYIESKTSKADRQQLTSI